MNTPMRKVTAGLAVGALGLVLAACGSSSSSSSSSSSGGGSASSGASFQSPASQTLGSGKKGGVLNVTNHEDFQHLDPGQAYFAIDYEAVYATQRSLYAYKPNDFANPIPDLASGPPVISPDKMTVTIKIRPGVRFSPPVNREVTAADVEYAIDRGANPNVANPYFGLYFADLKGFKQATGGPFPGVTTQGKYTIVFHLARPTAANMVSALVLPLSAPVPPEFARPLDAKKPTTYGNYLVATGPYMFKSDASGKVTGIGYDPGKSATLVRNPNWSASTDYRPAYVDQINISIGGDTAVIGRQVLTGSHIVQNDTPAQSIVKLAEQQYPKQITITPGTGNRYVALNNAKGPFTNVNLRRAVYAALPRLAMTRARGGKSVADQATHFLYPGTGGFDQAGGFAGPQLDFNASSAGNMAVAAKYLKLAGFPSGKYTGSQTIKVVGSTGDPAQQDAQIVNQTLQNLGFKTNFNLVDQSVMYAKYCGVPSQEIDVCPNVGWLADFGDPYAVLDVPFNGAAITATNNSNWGQVNNPQINAAMNAAALLTGPARLAAFANADKMLVDQAVAVPWDWDRQPQIEAKDVNGISDVWNDGGWDYDYTSLK